MELFLELNGNDFANTSGYSLEHGICEWIMANAQNTIIRHY